MNSRRGIVYLGLVFLLGLALGALATIWAGKQGWFAEGSRWQRSSKRGVEWLNRELNLTSEQRQQLELILDEMGEAYRAIRERTRPEYRTVRQQGRDKIRAILSQEQRAKFEQLVREIDEKEAQRHRKRDTHKRKNSSGSERK